jgi:hypothetical protein
MQGAGSLAGRQGRKEVLPEEWHVRLQAMPSGLLGGGEQTVPPWGLNQAWEVCSERQGTPLWVPSFFYSHRLLEKVPVLGTRLQNDFSLPASLSPSLSSSASSFGATCARLCSRCWGYSREQLTRPRFLCCWSFQCSRETDKDYLT